MSRVLAVLTLAMITCPLAGQPQTPGDQSQISKIKANAQEVTVRFGRASRLADFGCNRESVAYLDGFLSRQIVAVRASQQTEDRYVSLIGSFIGECILKTYPGKWVETTEGIHMEVQNDGATHLVRPFQKVLKRIEQGESESLVVYYGDLLPAALGKPPATRDTR